MALDNDTRQAIDNLKSKIKQLERKNESLEREVNLIKFRTKGHGKRIEILQRLFIKRTKKLRNG